MVAAAAAWVAGKVTAFVTGITTSLTAAKVVYAVTYYGTQIALTAGAAAALRAAQGTPDIDTVKGSKRQPIPPRIRAYGRRRLGGYYLLWEARENYAYDVVYLAEGPIEAVEEIWSHDKVLNVAPTGWVQGSPEYGGGNNDLIHVETRLGAPTETAYSAITAALGSSGVWTASHRGDGLATLGADYHHADKENLLDDFPNNEPVWAATGLWSPVWDPRDPAQDRTDPSTWTGAHANLALQILDFCLHPMGMAMDYETEIAPALEHWKGEADICDEAIALAAGGTEPRYWGSSYYAVPADPQEQLDRMLTACDGRLLKDQHGVSRLWVGKYRAPTVHLTDLDVAAHDLSGDAAAFDLANEIVPKFVDEAANWTLVPATAWTDADAVERLGRTMSLDLPLEACNSRAMSRRVGKAVLRRHGAPLRGSVTGRLSAAEALGQRWISIDLPDLGLTGAVFELEDGGRLAFSRGAVDLTVSLADPTAYDWNAATEEGATELVARPPATGLTPPEITGLTPVREGFGDAAGFRLEVEGEGPDREDLTWLVRWRVAGAGSWVVEEITDETAGAGFSGLTGFVTADAELEVQLGYQTGASGVQWSAIQTVTASTAGLAPPPPTGLSAVAVDGDIQLSADAPASDRFHHLRFWMGGAADDFEDAADQGEVAGSPGTRLATAVIGPAPGDYRVWVTAESATDAASSPVGPAAVTVPA